jgi:hypothetical protein
LSTGAKTPEGKARVLAALSEGRRRWIAQMKAEGKKFPWGRKAGYAWKTPAMREREIRVLQERVASPGRPTRSQLRTMQPEERRRAAIEALEGLRELFRRALK